MNQPQTHSTRFACIAILALVSARAGAQSLNVWTTPGTSGGPPAGLIAYGMCYDPVRDDVLIFGGNDGGVGGGPSPRTWTWAPGTGVWTEKVPPTSPGALHNPGVAWDPTTSRVMVFGGGNYVGGALLSYNDTWFWDGTNWTMASPATSPPARLACGMAFDTQLNRMVIFGGVDYGMFPVKHYGDTWVWNGATWTEIIPSVSAPRPPARQYFGMAYADGGRILLHGGTDLTTSFGDLWQLRGTEWSRLEAMAAPGPRQGQGMAYDSARRVVILFSGQDPVSATHPGDTWQYDPSTGAWCSIGQLADGRSNMSMVFDSLRRDMVRYAGYSPALVDRQA